MIVMMMIIIFQVVILILMDKNNDRVQREEEVQGCIGLGLSVGLNIRGEKEGMKLFSSGLGRLPVL